MNAQAGKLISRWHTDSFEKGEAMGIAKGEAMGIAKTIISVLEARGLTVTESQRQRVLDCTDVAQLNRWVDRSVTITDVAALFE
jgi:predicted transposase YdaD